MAGTEMPGDETEREVEAALLAGLQAEAADRSLELRQMTAAQVTQLLRRSIELYTGLGVPARNAAADLAEALRHAAGILEEHAARWPER